MHQENKFMTTITARELKTQEAHRKCGFNNELKKYSSNRQRRGYWRSQIEKGEREIYNFN
jgi:hypothetical protein